MFAWYAVWYALFRMLIRNDRRYGSRLDGWSMPAADRKDGHFGFGNMAHTRVWSR
jgi:hypothetical protein